MIPNISQAQIDELIELKIRLNGHLQHRIPRGQMYEILALEVRSSEARLRRAADGIHLIASTVIVNRAYDDAGTPDGEKLTVIFEIISEEGQPFGYVRRSLGHVSLYGYPV